MATFVNWYKVIYTRRWINYITFYIDRLTFKTSRKHMTSVIEHRKYSNDMKVLKGGNNYLYNVNMDPFKPPWNRKSSRNSRPFCR